MFFSPRFWNCLEKSRLFWWTTYFLELFVDCCLNCSFLGSIFELEAMFLKLKCILFFFIKSFIRVDIYHAWYVCIIQTVATDMRIAMTSIQPKIVNLMSLKIILTTLLRGSQAWTLQMTAWCYSVKRLNKSEWKHIIFSVPVLVTQVWQGLRWYLL